MTFPGYVRDLKLSMVINTYKIRKLDFVFLSFDEPDADNRYEALRTLVPTAKRVHGVKGFDAAHKECARVAATDRFLIVDADNFLAENFLEQSINDHRGR